MLPMPLAAIFVHWHGPIPPILRTVGPEPWSTVGQERRVELAGPGWMNESLTEVDPPRRFSYHLDEIHGPMSVLIATVDGRWQFEATPSGCKITWTWLVVPRAPLRWLMPAFTRLWTGYANRALNQLEQLLN